MIILLKFIFWFSLIISFYAYAGYPLVMFMLTLIKPGRKNGSEDILENVTPYVTLVISAYNEEDVIRDKLKNALESDYPKNRLEIIVASDASTDNTDQYVREFKDSKVTLFRQETRLGKTVALNGAVPLAKGEIIVFSDANSMYDRGAITRLVKHFQNSEIGFVTGKTRYILKQKGSLSESIGWYSRLECMTKRFESCVGSCVGADGAIFAVRKKLYRPLKSYDINDFVIPLNIIAQGYRGIYEDGAFCFEETAGNSREEFKRQVRIATRTIRALFNNRGLLNPLNDAMFAFEMISHKLLKFLVPLFSIALFFSNLLIFSAGIFYLFVMAMQVLFYLFAYKGHMAEKNGGGNGLTNIAHTFFMVNAAILLGWMKYFSGETYSVWSSDRVKGLGNNKIHKKVRGFK